MTDTVLPPGVLGTDDGAGAIPGAGALDPVEMPGTYKNLMDEARWGAMDPEVQRVIAERERRSALNKEEMKDRFFNRIQGLEEKVNGIAQTTAQPAEKPLAELASWTEASDNQIDRLIGQAQAKQAEAHANPDDDHLQQLSQQLMATLPELYQEKARRAAVSEIEAYKSETQAQRSQQEIEAAVMAATMQVPGVSQEVMKDENSPLRAEAEGHWKRMVQLNGGQDSPAFVWAAYSMAAMAKDAAAPPARESRANSVQVSGDQVLGLRNQYEAPRQRGDLKGASAIKKRLFFGGGMSIAPPR